MTADEVVHQAKLAERGKSVMMIHSSKPQILYTLIGNCTAQKDGIWLPAIMYCNKLSHQVYVRFLDDCTKLSVV